MERPGESSAARLLLQNGMQRVPTDKLELFQLRGFIAPELCSQLIALIDSDRRPSTIADDNGDRYFRTSETCDLRADHPAVLALEERLFALSGIAPVHGEPLQGQRYDIGQEFKAHCDWFNPQGQDYEKYCSIAGQRTWTFMVYLNSVEAGGATRFKTIAKSFTPDAGKLVCWNNRRPDPDAGPGGDPRPNPNTLHHGMKVRKGRKYVITKWYRERPYA